LQFFPNALNVLNAFLGFGGNVGGIPPLREPARDKRAYVRVAGARAREP